MDFDEGTQITEVHSVNIQQGSMLLTKGGKLAIVCFEINICVQSSALFLCQNSIWQQWGLVCKMKRPSDPGLL